MENKYVDGEDWEARKNVFVHIFVTSIVKTLRLSRECFEKLDDVKMKLTENCFFRF